MSRRVADPTSFASIPEAGSSVGETDGAVAASFAAAPTNVGLTAEVASHRDVDVQDVDAQEDALPGEDGPCELAEEIEPWEFHEMLLAGLLLFAVFYTIYFTRSLLFPITLAVMINLVFKPVVLRLERWRVPTYFGAAIVMVAFGSALAAGALALWTPATHWLTQLTTPGYINGVFEKLEPLQEGIEQIQETADKIQGAASKASAGGPIEVQEKPPSIVGAVLNSTWSVLGGAAITVVLLFFLLAGGDRFLEKAVELMPTFQDKRRMVDLTREMQQKISRYLLTITIINACLGLTIGLGLWAIGLSNPALWGVMAALLNYIPFAGAAIGAFIVFVVGMAEMHSLVDAALAPLLYLSANLVEANFVTPYLLGKAVSLNPVIILLAVFFWGWLWGIGGVLLAVPLLVAIKIVFDHSETFKPLGRFLAD